MLILLNYIWLMPFQGLLLLLFLCVSIELEVYEQMWSFCCCRFSNKCFEQCGCIFIVCSMQYMFYRSLIWCNFPVIHHDLEIMIKWNSDYTSFNCVVLLCICMCLFFFYFLFFFGWISGKDSDQEKCEGNDNVGGMRLWIFIWIVGSY